MKESLERYLEGPGLNIIDEEPIVLVLKSRDYNLRKPIPEELREDFNSDVRNALRTFDADIQIRSVIFLNQYLDAVQEKYGASPEELLPGLPRIIDSDDSELESLATSEGTNKDNILGRHDAIRISLDIILGTLTAYLVHKFDMPLPAYALSPIVTLGTHEIVGNIQSGIRLRRTTQMVSQDKLKFMEECEKYTAMIKEYLD